MPRVLSPDERALWRRVTADVRGEGGIEGNDATVRAAKPLPLHRKADPVARPTLPRPTAPRATLDGKWDRDLKGGKLSPDRTVDLHGCTLARAHDRALDALEQAVAAGERLVVVVTGKAPSSGTSRLDTPLRGIIRASIADWMQAAPFADRIAAIRPAHPRHGGSGALYVVLRRSDRR
ncbi:Smr/MutS family protein [Sphingomonas sp. SUN039]|uniref:Smr/MutS family protein n=1 Tax=Sphingomonas sp. SUN039 TaxID=2937787 RepID=UPI00216404E5|nr:Smr/MutS family protein [Sphingomonas sp. SUN039]UVO53031.1 Smr/MutS family protein [Sphingomonas sp. SUN039]